MFKLSYSDCKQSLDFSLKNSVRFGFEEISLHKTDKSTDCIQVNYYFPYLYLIIWTKLTIATDIFKFLSQNF